MAFSCFHGDSIIFIRLAKGAKDEKELITGVAGLQNYFTLPILNRDRPPFGIGYSPQVHNQKDRNTMGPDFGSIHGCFPGLQSLAFRVHNLLFISSTRFVST